jgi:hypothetical protein
MKAFSIGFDDATFDESKYARPGRRTDRRRMDHRDAARAQPAGRHGRRAGPHRRAPRRPVVPTHVPPLPIGGPPRQGGRRRRRRRRDVGRLPDLPRPPLCGRVPAGAG